MDENEEEQMNQRTMTVNEDNTKTAFLDQVQAILDEYSDVFPKDLPSGLPPARDLDHKTELVQELSHPIGHLTVCCHRGWTS